MSSSFRFSRRFGPMPRHRRVVSAGFGTQPFATSLFGGHS